jgi:ribose-phosphate pyrophosphokinase
MAVDLHAGQIQGFFSIPGDELSTFPLMSHYFAKKQVPNLTVVAADLGFAKKARNYAEALNAPVAFVEKRRVGPSVSSMAVIGDVAGQNVLVVDDEVDRGTTVAGAADILRAEGAKDLYLSFVHPTFSENAVDLLAKAGYKEIICTNTEPVSCETRQRLPNLTVLDLGPWLACVIRGVHNGLSVGATLHEFVETC